MQDYVFLIEAILFSVAALAWAGYELWTVRKRKDKGGSPPDDTRHPEG